jgi:hypothetical protein
MELETVHIVSQNPEEQGEFIVINKTDFDETIHVLYEPAAAPDAAAKPKK